MQFESKIKRNFWINLILGMTPDILISVMIAVLYDEDYLLAFFIVLVGLQIIYFLIWVKNTAWSWILYKYKLRKHYSSLVLDSLKKNHYPEPNEYLESSVEYFSSVAKNESLPVELRLNAATSLGFLNYPAINGQLQDSMRLAIAIEDAIENYKKTFDK